MTTQTRGETMPTDVAPRPGLVRRWLLRVPLIIGLLSLGIWLLPAIIATTPLRNVVLNMAQSQLPKGIKVGSATLAWSEPVQLRDVRVADASGREVLHVERIESEETLWELTRQRLSTGFFHLFRPRLTLVVRERSTMVDPAVMKFFKSQQRTISSKTGDNGVSLDFSNGEIALVDRRGNLLTEIKDVVVSFKNLPDTNGAGTLTATGRVTHPDTSGEIRIEAAWPGPGTAGRGRIDADLVNVPVDALNPRLRTRLANRTLSGSLSCRLGVRWEASAEGSLQSEAELDASSLQLALSPVGEEPAATWELTDASLESRISLDGRESIQIERLRVDSATLRADLSGEVRQGRKATQWDLAGELSAETGELLDLLGVPGEWLAVEGLAAQRVRLRGTYPGAAADDPLRAQGDLQWEALSAAGARSDDGSVAVAWQPGRVEFSPRSFDIGGGRIVNLPSLDLSSPQPVLDFEAAPVAENIELTEDMTRTWLKFVSPLLADATSVSGRFDLDSDEASLRLGRTTESNWSGAIEIKAAQVGPGPFARDALRIARQIESLVQGNPAALLGGGGGNGSGGRGRDRHWFMLSPQQIAVRVAEGRVHHDRIEYAAGDVLLRTSGSVGFDETLDLVVEVPIRDEWIGSRRGLAKLRGESLRIPVRGTLSAPEIDPRPLAEFNQRLAGRAAGGLLQRLIGP